MVIAKLPLGDNDALKCSSVSRLKQSEKISGRNILVIVLVIFSGKFTIYIKSTAPTRVEPVLSGAAGGTLSGLNRHRKLPYAFHEAICV